MEPLQQWICDTCRQLIQEPGHGYVEWLQRLDEPARAFHIVHHAPRSPLKPDGNCYQHTRARGRRDLPLREFVGPVGMVRLLSFLDLGEHHDPKRASLNQVHDMREFVEFARRLTLPHYEEARRYWNDAESDGFFDTGNEVWVYTPETLRRLAEKYRDE